MFGGIDLTPFDARYYFKSNLNLLLLINFFLTKKACHVVMQSSKYEEITFPHAFTFTFFCFSVFDPLSSSVVLI